MSEHQQRIEELGRFLRRKHEFLIDTLHEIRTPLDGIRGLAELVLRAEDGDLSEAQQRNLGLILDSSEQLRRLVNDLLQLEMLEKGEVHYEIVHFHMGTLVADLVPLCEALLEDKPEVALEVSLDPNLPPVHGDLRKIRQVLLNFLVNAIEFTESGSIRIQAATVGNAVQVEIRDTGIGIAAEEIEEVWEQFRQAGTGISPELEGAGLGLSINKKIIEAHGGEIGLASRPGEGSTFWFSLPTCESGLLPAMKRIGADGAELTDEVTWEAPVRPLPAGATTPVLPTEKPIPEKKEKRYREVPAGGGETVLIVDDSPVSVEILDALLKAHGYRVVVAADAASALEKLAAESPALIVTELWLPVMSGFDLVKKIRESDRLTPIMLLTARRDRESISYGLNLGADDYVQKPFDRSELLARIGVLLRLRHAQEGLLNLNLRLEAEVRKRTSELAAANERLYLSEKLSSLGQLTAGIAHELNNPLSYVLSNVEMVRERIAARRALDMIRRIRPLIRAAMGEGTRITLEETFLSALEEGGLFGQDVSDYRDEAAGLDREEHKGRFMEFLTYLESACAAKGGTSPDLLEGTIRLLDGSTEGLDRVRGIVRDLSAFSHPGSDEAAAVDANDSIRRVLTILTPVFRERDLGFKQTLRLAAPVFGVASRLDQVFLNLLTNAAQASPAEGIIRIRSRRDGRWGRVEVEDRGEGIPREVQSRIFDPFFTTKPVGEGTGLGLSICYRIVERMKGEITFKTRAGRGTTFVVRLPLAGSEEAS